MALRPALLLFLLLSLLVAQTRAAPFSLVYENGIWPKKELTVCYGDSSHFAMTAFQNSGHEISTEEVASASAPYRRMIESVVNREFTAERTSIHFTGWKDCSPSANEADVILFISKVGVRDNSLTGRASVGEGLDVKSADPKTGAQTNDHFYAGKKAFVYLLDPRNLKGTGTAEVATEEEVFAMTALHEFGHVVGLGHEHSRIDAKHPDLNCQMTDDFYSDHLTETPAVALGKNVRKTGAYDPNSIMNYCWLQAVGSISGTKFLVDSSLPSFHFVPVDENALSYNYVSPIYPKRSEEGVLRRGSVSLTDPSLYTEKKLNDHQTEYEIKIGLSKGDLHAIRCFYQYDEATRADSCTEK